MNCFLDVFGSVLVVMSAHILDYVALREWDAVPHYEFGWLYLHFGVVVATHLLLHFCHDDLLVRPTLVLSIISLTIIILFPL